VKRLSIALVWLIFLVPTLTFAQTDDPLQTRKDAIYNLLDQAYNFGNIADVATLFADEYVRHPDEGDSTSFIISALALRAAMPDLQAFVDLLIGEGELVAARLRLQGTFQNELIFPNAQPIPPNNQPVTIAVQLMFRFNDDGQVIEEWDAFDNLHFFAQLGLVPAPQNTPTIPMTTVEILPTELATQNKDTVTQFFAGLNEGNFSLIDQHFREDFVAHNPFGVLDRAGLSIDLNMLRSALPDTTWTVDQLMAEGNWAAALYTVRGTFTNSFPLTDTTSVPPTGATLQLLTITFYRFDELGAVAETWEVYDSFSFLTQLGLLAFVAPSN
jgi:predicted ester cyclase